MVEEFAAIREAFDHNGLVGGEGEKLVSQFLRSHLPLSIGVTTGQVLDVDGNMSKQVDVIVYDAMRTPMLFAGPAGDTHLVPAEGVLAVVEVKTRLTADEVRKSLANARSVKSRRRTAYFPQAVQLVHHAYGREWAEPPIHYSVFAAHSDNMYADLLNELQADVPPHGRIDMLCHLDRGVSLNADVDFSNGVLDIRPVISPRSLAQGGLANVTQPEKALMVWFGLVAGTVMGSGVRPIDITQYLAHDLAVEASLPGGAIAAAMYERAAAALSTEIGLPQNLLEKFGRAEELTLQEQYDLLRNPAWVPSDDAAPNVRAYQSTLSEGARTMTFEQFVDLAARTDRPADLPDPSQ